MKKSDLQKKHIRAIAAQQQQTLLNNRDAIQRLQHSIDLLINDDHNLRQSYRTRTLQQQLLSLQTQKQFLTQTVLQLDQDQDLDIESKRKAIICLRQENERKRAVVEELQRQLQKQRQLERKASLRLRSRVQTGRRVGSLYTGQISHDQQMISHLIEEKNLLLARIKEKKEKLGRIEKADKQLLQIIQDADTPDLLKALLK